MSTPPVDDLVRKEVRHVSHPRAVWTSFDRYSRYSALAGVVRATLGPGRHRVLDVGDASGYLLAFDDDVDVVSLDMAAYGEPLQGAVRVRGDGARLPFADASFDAIISSDALEHVLPADRDRFLGEAARVARSLVVVAAPFDTPGVGGAEELVRRFVLLSTGAPQEQLDEHREHGLPDLDQARGALAAAGLSVDVRGNGNLHDWVSMMLLKHQLAPRPALDPLATGYDIAYNHLLTQRNGQAPFYRHVVAGVRDVELRWPSPVGPAAADAAPLLAGFLSANVAESVRMDVVPGLADVASRTARVEARLEQVQATLAQLQQSQAEQRLRSGSALDRIEAALGALHGRLDTLALALRSPLRAARSALRRG